MDPRTDSQGVGKHSLGPHVIGKRVVVRRLLRGETGPTGGPAFTDVLGICTSWGEGICTVAPHTGASVQITIADIVSGKPVPPRPSVRHRASAQECERHALALWPDMEREGLGEWHLRSDPASVAELLKPANSALAIGDPGVPLAAAESAVVDFYRARDRQPLIQVEAGSDIDIYFAGRGWSVIPDGDAHFQIASLARTSRALRGKDQRGDLAQDGDRLAVSVQEEHRVIASARAALSGDWVGIHGFTVTPEHRRQGLATAMLAAIVDWAGEKGASTLWLHVEVSNIPALSLCEPLGFTTHHSLRYLTQS